MRADSDIRFFAFADHDLAVVCKTTGQIDDFLLLGFYLRQADRAAHFHLFTQQFASTGRHIAKEVLLEVVGGALERDDQRIAVDVLQQALDRVAVDIQQVGEDEHFVDDLLGQIFVVVAQSVEGFLFVGAVHHVEDLGRRMDTADTTTLDLLAAQHAAQYLIEFCHGCRLNAVEGRDAQQDVVTQRAVEQRQYVGRLTTRQMDDDGGDDLRMFVADDFGHHGRFHAVECLNATFFLFLWIENLFHEAVGAVFAQGLEQDRAHMVRRIDAECAVLIHFVVEHVQRFADLLVRDLADLHHGTAQQLHVLDAEVLEHLDDGIFFERQHQDGAALKSRRHVNGLIFCLRFHASILSESWQSGLDPGVHVHERHEYGSHAADV
ncbi:DNA-directed RNA polymerase, beta' subunit/160 kD [Zymobacter palmae]|uniref:DNA-directed RNA polymerase, beta' subunit/160 kD n=1 Tax=Zymobacter palmae TaxID=33074 RepID=A0A348HFD9_9GAMM|nr:DNA-directed RNA polymerase, beta' subunit/160 kD [Zymobacter palmae]